MRIATWNLERPKRPKTISLKNDAITDKLNGVDADILVLTETSECIDLGMGYQKFTSEELKSCPRSIYSPDDRRTTVWVQRKYLATKEIVSDADTSVCVNVKTGQGELLAYGTIIGVFGHPSQNVDGQIDDWRRVSQAGQKSICIAGDFNVQFGRPSRFTDGSRDKIIACFNELKIRNLTNSISENIDHIAVSEAFVQRSTCTTGIWNEDKTLSDHIGVWVNIENHEGSK